MADFMTPDDKRWMPLFLQQQRFARIKRAGDSGSGEITFPAKSFYFNDFTGIANNTKLRDLPGWAAYNSASSTSAVRDQWQVQSNAITRMNASTDFATRPGLFVLGRETVSTDHVIKAKMTTLPNAGLHFVLVAAATNESNCVFLECTNSAGVMQSMIIQKNTAGALVSIGDIVGVSSALGRAPIAGDTFELRVLGQRVHLFVNDLQISPVAGYNLDQSTAFTKGNRVGFGTRSNVGVVFDDVYAADLSATLSMLATPIFWPGSVDLGGRSIPLSGTYSGTVEALDYRVVNAATGAQVKAWARVPAPTIAGNAWSANVFVPMCDTAVNPKIKIQVRAANDTDATALSTTTCVGLSVVSYGQSNAFLRGLAGATVHAVSNAYTWSTSASSVWQGGSSTTDKRCQLWASKIAEVTGVPCGVVAVGVSSRTIEMLVNAEWPGTIAEITLANALGYAISLNWTQGEAESGSATTFNEVEYRDYFDDLLSQFRSQVAGNANAPVGVTIIGSYLGAHPSGATFGNANWSAGRAVLSRLGDKPNTYISSSLIGAVHVDDYHYTADSYVEQGRRDALSMRKALGYGGYDGRGPIITGANRSGAVITLPLNLNGATSVAGTGLTNYDVSTNDFSSTLAISSAVVSGSNIVITLAADPGAPVKVRSFYGMTYGTPTRAIGTYADGTTIPVEPLYIPVIAS